MANFARMKINHTIHAFCLLLLLTFVASCSGNREPSGQAVETPETDNSPQILEFTAVGLSLDGPSEATAGWNTLHLTNNSAMVHFAMLTKLLEGRDINDHKDLAAVFQNIMDNINGKEISAPDAGMEVPAWYSDSSVVYGGPGFVSPGGSAQVSLNLEPGYYIMECYVKTDGIFHSFNPIPSEYGMVHVLNVVAGENNAEAPSATSRVIITSTDGITSNGTLVAGSNVGEVEFGDQIAHEHFLGHDVQLVKLDSESDTTALGAWMNWTAPDGLQTPSPVTFVGGTQDMTAGSVTYLHLDLTPGLYAWVAEVPDPNRKNMLKLFTIE